MPHHPPVSLTGRVTDVFAHRFVVETKSGERRLADLGPKGAEAIGLKAGDEISLEGEAHPSEIKVTQVKRGDASVAISHPPKPPKPAAGDPAVALRAVKAAGAAVLGEPMAHPKHYEVLGQQGSTYTEYHVTFDGHIRKTRPVGRDDRKWASVIGH